MLRILLGTGALLMAVGFGAAGWQYWQSLPKAEPVAAAEEQAVEPSAPKAVQRQRWLMPKP